MPVPCADKLQFNRRDHRAGVGFPEGQVGMSLLATVKLEASINHPMRNVHAGPEINPKKKSTLNATSIRLAGTASLTTLCVNVPRD